jgi:hypothetical protein
MPDQLEITIQNSTLEVTPDVVNMELTLGVMPAPRSHSDLTDLDAAGSHPIAAVAGLTAALASKAALADWQATDAALTAHVADLSNPHGVTAVQVGADPTGTASGLVASHAAGSGVHAISGVTGLQSALDLKADASSLTAHTSNTSNPHAVTAAQLGITDVGSGIIISAAERTKLSGIEALADVTDTANVTAAGAAMLTGASFTGAISVVVTDAATTTTTDVLSLTHSTSGTASTEFGTGVLFRAEDSAGNTDDIGRLAFVWPDATSTSEDSTLSLHGRLGGAALAEYMRIGPTSVVWHPGAGPGATVGNARGLYAIDLQANRNANTQVASGDYSFLAGTFQGTASGMRGVCVGGVQPRAVGIGAALFNANYGYAAGQSSIVIGGESNACYTQESIVLGGRSNEGRATWAVAIGGHSAFADHVGGIAHANGAFSAVGDAQIEWYVVRASTTDATPTELKAGVSPPTQRFTLSDDSTYAVTVTVVARRTDANNESAGWKKFLVIDRNSGTTALVGSVADLVTPIEDTVAWDVAVTANDTNDFIAVTATGEVGKTIRWVAFMEVVKVTG